MGSIARASCGVLVGLSVLTGVAYPLAITGIAKVLAPERSRGSIVRDATGTPVASSLIGQEFSTGDIKTAAGWFWGRPSATSPTPYTALNLEKGTGSGGSNLALSNPALVENIKARLERLDQADAAVGLVRPNGGDVPIDLVTSSASGLDPHVSPAAAEYQTPRVALARGIPEAKLRELVRKHTTGRMLGIIGEPVVDYGAVNRELAGVARR